MKILTIVGVRVVAPWVKLSLGTTVSRIGAPDSVLVSPCVQFPVADYRPSASVPAFLWQT